MDARSEKNAIPLAVDLDETHGSVEIAEAEVRGRLALAEIAAARSDLADLECLGMLAIRHDSELVAAFGLIAVLAAPPLLGASPTLVTILFLATALIGTTVIALFRTWIWLPPLAFLLAVPQVASSAVGGESVPVAMATIAGFWLLNTIAAGGEEIRHPTDRLRPRNNGPRRRIRPVAGGVRGRRRPG